VLAHIAGFFGAGRIKFCTMMCSRGKQNSLSALVPRPVRAGLTLLVIAGILAGCRGKEPAGLLRGEFTPTGALRVNLSPDNQWIEVRDGQGRVLAKAYPHGQPVAEVLFRWTPAATYCIRTDRGEEAIVEAPGRTPALAIRLHAPLGQTPHEAYLYAGSAPPAPRIVLLAAEPAETLDLMLEVEKLDDGPARKVRVSASFPEWRNTSHTLELQFEKRIWTARLQIGEELSRDPTTVEVTGEGFRIPFEVRFARSRPASEQVEVVSWRLPTGADGSLRPGQPEDRIAMPNPVWDRLAVWFGLRPQVVDYLKPYTYQTLELRNRGALPVSLAVTGEVVDPVTGRTVPGFDPPRWDASGGSNRTMVFVEVEAGGAPRRCVLPLYVRPDTAAGAYLRRVRIQPLGSDKVVATLEVPLGVTRGKPFLTVWVMFIVVLSLGWLILVIASYRRLVTGMGVRALVLLSLLGALQFCLGLLGGWVSNLLYAFLGPFNCLVGGFLTELLTYLIVTSILCLLPRPGAMTLAGIITYLMGAILFGSFGLTDLLFVGSAIAFREILLYVFGVTRRKPGDTQPPPLVPMMLALGLADAAAIFTSLALFAIFYRLFYANWYILLNAGVTGFLYTCVGVYFGRKLGLGLRKVHL